MSTSNHPFLDHQFLQTKPPSLTMAETLRWKPTAVEVAPNCPRCFSSNTKFCYYNNYSVSQPRYFCKSCRRYWTKGGSLRNVPIGGGCRKSRRSRSRDCPSGAAEPISGSESGGDADAAASVKEPDLEGGVIDGGDCLYEDFDGFGLGSEMVWSEQPLMQEFEVFTNDDDHQLRMSDENWGLFDLSAYENFN